MNIVTIDPSILNTGMTINGIAFTIASKSIAHTSKGVLKKWFERADYHCQIFPVDTSYNNETSYSKLELAKLQTYHNIVNIIRALVSIHTEKYAQTLVVIEGYSYSSVAGPLIDLVTFSTLVRECLSNRPQTKVVVLAPTSMKKLAAQVTYTPIEKGKKVKKIEYRNHEGVAGGSFTKHHIYQALIENDELDCEWVKFLRTVSSEALDAKAIPKPLEDVNNAVMMQYIARKAYKDNNEDFMSTVNALSEI